MNKLKWGQPEKSDLPTPAAFGQLEHAGQRMQPLFTARQMQEYAAHEAQGLAGHAQEVRFGTPELTRMLNAERAAVQALREQVRLAYLAGTDDFRRFYDAELFRVIGVTGFYDLYSPAGSVAPQPLAQVQPLTNKQAHGIGGVKP